MEFSAFVLRWLCPLLTFIPLLCRCMSAHGGVDEDPGTGDPELGPDEPKPTPGSHRAGPSRRDRSRSPRSPRGGSTDLHGGHVDCPQYTHCAHCVAAGDYLSTHNGSTETGCCGSSYCHTDEPDWTTTVLARPTDATPAHWRLVAYKAAFRRIHGIGQRGVRVPHSTCVVYNIKYSNYVEQQPPQETQADAGQAG